jgi:dnaD domain protein
MARPTKKGLDYFPHDTHTDQDTALALVEAEFGLEAYAVYFKLLEFIYSQGYAIPWGSDECLLFAKRIGAFGVSSRISEIVKGLVRRSLFDEGVLNSFRMLTSASIQVRWLEAKRKKVEDIEKNIRLVPDNRTAPKVSTPENSVNTTEKEVFAEETGVFAAKTQVIAETTPQSKVKKRKEDNTTSPIVEVVRPKSDAQSSGGKEKSGKSKKGDLDLEAFARFFNDTMAAHGAQIPQVRSIPPNSKRAAYVRARLKEHGKEALAKVVQNAAKLSFYNGGGARGWVADFDWLFRPSNFLRVLEDTRANAVPKSTNVTTTSQHGATAKSVDDNRERQRQRGEYFDDMLVRLTYGNG